MPRGTRLTRRRLDAWQLKIGMYVCEVDRPWRETPFLFQGFPLLTAADIQAVQACCQYVFIDELQQVQVSPTDTPPPATGASRCHANCSRRATASRPAHD